MSADPSIRPANPPPTKGMQRALIERQMAKLERLAEIGMEIAEAAGRRAASLAEMGGTEDGAAGPGLSFARAARVAIPTAARAGGRGGLPRSAGASIPGLAEAGVNLY